MNLFVQTVNGKPTAVLQDVDSYQQMSDAEYRESVAILRERLADIDNADKWLTHKEVFDQLRRKYNIKRRLP